MSAFRALRNPVLERELIDQVRGWRPAAIVTLLLLLQGWILYVSYDNLQGNVSINNNGAVDLVKQGATVFAILVAVMIGWMTMVVPGLCAAAIAGERERDTLLPLQITLMGPWSITLGKLLSSLGFVLLLVVASAPLMVVAYLMGGVTIGQIATAVGLVMWTAFVWACLCLAVSALLQRTVRAMVTCYMLIFLIVVGSMVYTALNWRNDGVQASRGGPLLANPGALAIDVLGSPDPDLERAGIATPFDKAARWLHDVSAWEPTVTELSETDVPDVFLDGGGEFGGMFSGAGNVIVTREVMGDGSMMETVTVEDGGMPATTIPGSEPGDGDSDPGDSGTDALEGMPAWALQPDGTFDIDNWILVDGSPVPVQDAKMNGWLPMSWDPGDVVGHRGDPAKNFTRNALILQSGLAIISLGIVAWRLRLPKEKIRL
ncbi:MAG: ABC transporter permease [Actinobacteria bacterium]|nr:ABC transporter permease [Actinomycetota bacterium]MCB9389682.1 ABC transporter permease [Acidimicrobiia bacterium]